MSTTETTPVVAGEVVTGEVVSTKSEAASRARRTFWPNFLVDLLIAVGPLAYDAVSGWDGSFTAAYWTIVVVSLVRTAVLTAIAFVMRFYIPPRGETVDVTARP